MAKANVVVDVVTGLTPPSTENDQNLIIQLRSHPAIFLSSQHPQVEILEWMIRNLMEGEQPQYFELLPDSRQINDAAVPLSTRIESVELCQDNGLEIDLIDSHAIHYLRANHPEYDKASAALRRAIQKNEYMLVTADDQHQVLDVRLDRFFDTNNGVPPPAQYKSTGKPITRRRADALFEKMQDQGCCKPRRPAAPCLPFLYPDNGCFGRAHEMCRLLIEEEGERPEKIWAYQAFRGPRLRPQTPNHYDCYVTWGKHVAPVLNVESGQGSEWLVVDPSLFDTLATTAQWKARFRARSQTVQTGPEVYIRSNQGNITHDVTYLRTSRELRSCRVALAKRSNNPNYGPPPYKKCLSKTP